MRTDGFSAFYASWEWRRCREDFIKSRGGLCERCLAKGIVNAGTKEIPLQVHHKDKLTADNVTDPAVALNWDNLELLCKRCHDEQHAAKMQRRWSISPDGAVDIAPLVNLESDGATGSDVREKKPDEARIDPSRSRGDGER